MTTIYKYYPRFDDTLNDTNLLSSNNNSTTTGTYAGFIQWKVSISVSTQSSSWSSPFNNDTIYNLYDPLPSLPGGTLFLYPASAGPVPFFLEGTTVLCQDNGEDLWTPIESITIGTLVKTLNGNYVPVVNIGKRTIYNLGTGDCLYKCSTSQYSDLANDLFVVGSHCILVDSSILNSELSASQISELDSQLGQNTMIGSKNKLLTYMDPRAEPWNSPGLYTVYHLALQSASNSNNYGIYVNGSDTKSGMTVETASINYLNGVSNIRSWK